MTSDSIHLNSNQICDLNSGVNVTLFEEMSNGQQQVIDVQFVDRRKLRRDQWMVFSNVDCLLTRWLSEEQYNNSNRNISIALQGGCASVAPETVGIREIPFKFPLLATFLQTSGNENTHKMITSNTIRTKRQQLQPESNTPCKLNPMTVCLNIYILIIPSGINVFVLNAELFVELFLPIDSHLYYLYSHVHIKNVVHIYYHSNQSFNLFIGSIRRPGMGQVYNRTLILYSQRVLRYLSLSPLLRTEGNPPFSNTILLPSPKARRNTLSLLCSYQTGSFTGHNDSRQINDSDHSIGENNSNGMRL